jgi:cold shock CspA family protein
VFEVPCPVESEGQSDCQAWLQNGVLQAGTGMSRGVITKVVRSFGSTWGLVRQADAKHELFFNLQSMLNKADSANLRVGQEVEFDEEVDQANGTRALRMRPVWVEPYSDFINRSRPDNKGAEAAPTQPAWPGVQG